MHINKVVLLIATGISFCLGGNFTETNAVSWLEQYGYITTSETASTDITETLEQFQERYNLPVDGKLNKETMELMQKPRCTQGENAYAVKSAWKKFDIKWYFPQATPQALTVTKRVFEIWEEASKFKFTYLRIPNPKPDITITVVPKQHYFRYNCQGNDECPFKFTSGVLAHSYFPPTSGCIEIHMNSNLTWDFSLNSTAEGRTNFFAVLLHEVGHALGLAHSSDKKAVMYPFYETFPSHITDDDKRGLEKLYGHKSKSASIPTKAGVTRSSSPTTTERSRSTTTTAARTNKSKQNIITNVCELEYPDLIFLAYAPSFPTYRMYIVSKDLVWKYDLNNEKIPTNAEQFIRYFPGGITNVTQVFQSTNGDLIGVSRNRIYAAAFPSLRIHTDNMVPEINNARSINGLFQTNSGKKFVCFDGSFIEFNDKDIISRGRISDVFPGIPNDITSAFNYIDGHIYFLKHNIYYKFNEFTRSVIEKGTFNWNMLGIPCPDNGLIKQLKSLLSKVNLFYE
ncbi:matrix metalloproteinase-18-like [Diabrotica virgifera virgifera]|uniref:Peptidase metallopeptidase domain-containing protein n=1 Tax=Diabrotica virgifera virgifera TaxID=50390 RepID=A0ABM5L951_DIAVI|nr:matrix metalloproteinase-18-like [Diabrotica virgifera virgifera]